MFEFLHQRKTETKPKYLDRIDELEKVRIVRLKGNIDHEMIPVIEARIQENRKREGIVIDKNIILDYTQVGHVDTATIAFHMVRVNEIKAAGHKVGFLHTPDQLNTLLSMFKQSNTFKLYSSEDEAVRDLNQ